jgi:hypothetical protein
LVAKLHVLRVSRMGHSVALISFPHATETGFGAGEFLDANATQPSQRSDLLKHCNNVLLAAASATRSAGGLAVVHACPCQCS